MRVTLAELRGIRREGASWRPNPPGTPIVTPAPVRRKAVCIYHDETHSDALAYMNGKRPGGSLGLTGAYGPGGSRASQGTSTRNAFARYTQMDGQDGRPVAELNLIGDVSLGRHQVRTTVDVVVFAQNGYGGRLLVWDQAGVTDALTDVLAAPAALLIDEKLGSGTAAEIEVWDLERGIRFVRTRAQAFAQVPAVGALLDQTANVLGVP